MREVLVQIAARLREAPGRAEELVLRRGAVSDQLHAVLDAIRDREAEIAGAVAAETDGNGGRRWPNEAARNAEIRRRLAADSRHQELRRQAEDLRRELRMLDAEIEHAAKRHSGDAGMARLAAALLNAGMREEAEAALAAYGAEPEAAEAPQAREAGAEPEAEQPRDGRLETGTFTVLEVRPGRGEGAVRAWCEAADGTRAAVYARDAAAAALARAAGRRVRIRFRRLDRGLFAVSVAE